METVLLVTRFGKTEDAYFGEVSLNGAFICYSMERISVAIPLGSYRTVLEESPHFGHLTPHLSVPGRTYIEIHAANYPYQLEGCLAVGLQIDGDALDNSDSAFSLLMGILPPSLTVEVCMGEQTRDRQTSIAHL